MYKNWLTEDIESMASSINYSEILKIAKKIDLKNAFKENSETLSKREYFEKLNLRAPLKTAFDKFWDKFF